MDPKSFLCPVLLNAMFGSDYRVLLCSSVLLNKGVKPPPRLLATAAPGVCFAGYLLLDDHALVGQVPLLTLTWGRVERRGLGSGGGRAGGGEFSEFSEVFVLQQCKIIHAYIPGMYRSGREYGPRLMFTSDFKRGLYSRPESWVCSLSSPEKSREKMGAARRGYIRG